MSPKFPMTLNSAFKKNVRVRFIILSATFQITGLAMLSAWSSPSIPILIERGYSEQETNNVVTFYVIGILIAPIISCLLLSKAGRKTSILFCTALNVISSFLQFGEAICGLLYLGRLLAGISSGCLGVILPIYQAECFHPIDRERSGGILSLFLSVGLCIEYVIAPFLSYNSNNITIAVVCVISLISFPILAEESPVVLLKRDQEALARSVVELFWSPYECEDGSKIMEELDKIKITLIEARTNSTWEVIKSIFTNKCYLKSSLLVLLVMIGCNITGVLSLVMFLQPIIIEAGTPYSSAVCSAVSGVLMVVAGLLSPWFVDKLGIKRTLVFGINGYLLCMICLGLYFCLQYYQLDVSKLYWLPVASVAGFSTFTSLGILVLPYMLRGELLAPRIQSIMAPASDLLANLSNFLATMLYTQLPRMHFVTFWVFSVILIVEEILIIVYLPDTRRLSKSEIHDLFMAK